MAYKSRQVRDYYVACSNGLTCELAIHDFDTPLTGLAITRKGGPATPVEVRFDMAMPLAEGSQVSISVDGGPAVTFSTDAMRRDSETTVYRLDAAETVAALIGAFTDGDSVAVTYVTDEGETTSAYSLAGMKAGLLYMDEVQGRLNATDALVSKGERTPDAPSVRDFDEVTQLPEAIRGDFTSDDGKCRFLDAERFGRAGGFEAEIGEGAYLIGLPCSEGGAYNQPFVFYWREGANVFGLHLPVMTQFGPSTESYVWNASWSHRERILEGFFKGRGIGDCGVFNRWVLNDSLQEPAFILRETRVKEDCDGDNMGGVEFWPPVWPRQ